MISWQDRTSDITYPVGVEVPVYQFWKDVECWLYRTLVSPLSFVKTISNFFWVLSVVCNSAALKIHPSHSLHMPEPDSQISNISNVLVASGFQWLHLKSEMLARSSHFQLTRFSTLPGIYAEGVHTLVICYLSKVFICYLRCFFSPTWHLWKCV